ADNDRKATEIANLQTRTKQQQDDYSREKETLTSMIKEQRDALERTDTILDRPDGKITYVDYEQREVQVDITRRRGARPQMTMTVFDAQSQGIPPPPTQKPKGTIELTKIGEQFSVARIIPSKEYDNPSDPIRDGDLVYSPAWSPNTKLKFALVGKI